MKKFEEVAAALMAQADPQVVPDMVKPVCIVSGKPYDMGYQLGLESGRSTVNHVLVLASRIRALRPDTAGIMKDAEAFGRIMEEQSPDIAEMWQGTADALSLPYEAMLLGYIPNLMQPVVNHCSSLSVWGSAAEEGKLINAVNADGGSFTPTSFGPTMVLYPENGYASMNNGGYNSNFALNEKGLVTMATNGGWNGRPGDEGYGTPAVLSTMQLNLHCADTAEALQRALEINRPTGSAENMHFADPAGDVCVVEMTNGHHAVRRSGDNGEKDYLHATNYFLSPEMQSSKPTDLRRTQNAVSRFITEDRLLRDSLGHITLDTLEKIITCRDYFDGEHWVRDAWDPEYSTWTPEKRSFRNDTYMQSLAEPTERTAYFRQGKGCRPACCVPGATARFSRLVLKPTAMELAEQAVVDAKIRFYRAAAKLSAVGEDAAEPAYDRLDRAKRCIWEGENHKALALLTEDANQRMVHLSKAVTLFCKAQVLADL